MIFRLSRCLTADADFVVLKYWHAAAVVCVNLVTPTYRKHSALLPGTNAKRGRNFNKLH